MVWPKEMPGMVETLEGEEYRDGEAVTQLATRIPKRLQRAFKLHCTKHALGIGVSITEALEDWLYHRLIDEREAGASIDPVEIAGLQPHQQTLLRERSYQLVGRGVRSPHAPGGRRTAASRDPGRSPAAARTPRVD